MKLTYGIWIGLMIIGIIAGTYLIIIDKGRTPKVKRELLSSIFFTFVMLCISIVSIFEIGISRIFAISLFFFFIGLLMIIHGVRKIKDEKEK